MATSGKSLGIFIFVQGQGKVREFCKMVREILNTKKVMEKLGNFLILAQNCLVLQIFYPFGVIENLVIFFSLASLA